MICPNCANHEDIPMTESSVGRVTVDRCEHCGGVWLDPGELEAIVGAAVEHTELAIAKTLKLSWLPGRTDAIRLEATGPSLTNEGSLEPRVLPLRDLHRLAGRETTDALYLRGHALWRCPPHHWDLVRTAPPG